MSYKPLAGLTVIELASVLAGPAVGMFFAELGARVIKIENQSRGGDMTRSWKLKSEDPSSPISAYFSSVNYQKEYVDLDLTQASDRERIQELISEADVFLNNMKDSSAIRFGVDGPSLRARYPALIIAILHGFAQGSEHVAFDIVLQAETGYISMCGSEGHPAKLPIAFIDILAAHQLKEAILLAMIQKGKDGKGALITTSLEECALSSLANQASNYLMEGLIARPMGTLHPNIAPYGEILETREGDRFVLAIGTDRQFRGLCDILNLDIAADIRFSVNQQRLVHRDELYTLIVKASNSLDSEEFYAACLAQKVPMGKIKSLDEVLESSTANSMLLSENIEGVSTRRLSSVAFAIER